MGQRFVSRLGILYVARRDWAKVAWMDGVRANTGVLLLRGHWRNRSRLDAAGENITGLTRMCLWRVVSVFRAIGLSRDCNMVPMGVGFEHVRLGYFMNSDAARSR